VGKGEAQYGLAVMVRCGSLWAVWFGTVRWGQAWLGGQGGVRQVLVLSGLVRRGGLGVSR